MQLLFQPSKLAFSGSPESTGQRLTINVMNTYDLFVALHVTTISVSGCTYAPSIKHCILCPQRSVEITVVRTRSKQCSPVEGTCDLLCFEGIGLCKMPPNQISASRLWPLLVSRGVHITSWTVPCTLESDEANASFEHPLVAPTDSYQHFPEDSLLPKSRWVRFEGPGGDAPGCVSPLPGKAVSDRTGCCIQKGRVRLHSTPKTAKEIYAVKILKDHDNAVAPEERRPRSIVARAKAELAIWSRLKHKNIAPLIGVLLFPRFGFISLFYTGGNVLQYVQQRKADGRVRLHLMKGAAAGLLYMHSRFIIHGDIKHDNVLVDHNGNAIIIDFGLSIIKDDSFRIRTTAGNKAYLPLTIQTQQRKSFVTDIFAFGLLLLEVAIRRRALPSSSLSYHPTVDDLARFRFPELAPTSALWGLLEKCWRPGFDAAIDMAGCFQTLNSFAACDIDPNILL